MEERDAYCRLDSNGDIEDVIRIVKIPKSVEYDGGTIVTIRAKELAEFMVLSETALVVHFDFTRFKPRTFDGWSEVSRETRRGTDLFYNLGTMPAQASYVNGFQVVRPAITREQLVEDRKREDDPSSKDYAAFKTYDWKNQSHVVTSCSPEATSNYFQKDSSLPFDLSPAFFRAEVLHRFKADPEKYTLEDRRIDCRGAWFLETYDISEKGQVHTYLKYLSYLPYEEQLYWQSFNEWPKGSISKRALQTDFEGTWSTDYDPVASLKSKIRQLDKDPPNWWNIRGEELSSAVHYPVTTSPSEWAAEIMALDQLTVEGFRINPLRTIAEKLGRPIEKEWRSLKLIEECFIGLGRNAEEAKKGVVALKKLHDLRNHLKGHSAIAERKKSEKQALIDFSSFHAHFTGLAKECDEAIADIVVALENVQS